VQEVLYHLSCTSSLKFLMKNNRAWAWWYTSIIPATQEMGAGRSRVQGQPGLHSEALAQQNKTQTTRMKNKLGVDGSRL
jgi:hypothetical protein